MNIYFQILGNMNNAAMNTRVQISLWDPDFNSFVYILRFFDTWVLLYHEGVLLSIVWETSVPFSIAAIPLFILNNYSTSSSRLFFCFAMIYFIMAILKCIRWYITVILICIKLLISGMEYIFIYFLVICISS
jgi:hypothetical protein